jgi:amino-acid N-acetyltransferase
MGESPGLINADNELVRQCTVNEAADIPCADAALTRLRDAACRACRQGVERAHIISFTEQGALLAELFTHDGVGSLISEQQFEQARGAGMDDIAGIIELVRPLEDAGILVRRSRDLLEQEIGRFRVLERDGRIIACAALYAFPSDKIGEIACIAIHPDYRSSGRGDNLLQLLCQEARELGLESVFVLTTQTSHWFRERGFESAGLDTLPSERKGLYNLQRNSQVMRRSLTR